MTRRIRPARPEEGAQTFVTPRGVGLAAAGAALLGVGIGFASAPLVLIGAATLVSAVVGAAWIAAQTLATRATVTGVRRDVSPPTLSAGGAGVVAVHVRAQGPIARTLRLKEQAASELTGGGSTRATIAGEPGGIVLRYSLAPVSRGRWVLGPALSRASDPFGLAWSDRTVGGTQEVAVWPAVVDLAASAGDLMGAADRAHAGARTPAADDVSLRDYRDGDDLRRVHWASSARRGTLVVRSEEQQGRTAATILLGLPPSAPGLEWAISAAASVALSVVEAGHPVRLIAGGTETSAMDTHGRAAESARARLLDATVDLTAPETTADADHTLAADAARVEPGHRDVVVAVIEPVGRSSVAALAPLGESSRAWAMIRASLAGRARAERTAEALRAAGWRAIVTLEPESIVDAWGRLLTEEST
ncbi:DUF58 domain-containing protein [Demequina sp.]|uniref:DUF58 domain-containing protein n=1 Tax=Demequina sp. TaxID=2050685 RepID=UPI0025CFCBA8|nr:DUF58 domain-containing protein [Demequina sp.]